MDSFALRAANAVAGNDLSAAGLEWALGDGSITFEQDVAFALGGAKAHATLAGKVVAPCTTTYARSGDALTIEQISAGRFLYVAVSGGIDVPIVLGSRST
jgi:antagonist of KipI